MPRRVVVDGVEQVVYDMRVDPLPCCGCVVHPGAEVGACDCRCHWAARLAARRP